MCRRWMLGMAITGALVAALPMGMLPARAQADETGGSQDTSAVETYDQLVMASGRALKGQIVKETDTYVDFIVEFNGITSGTPTRYMKSEILEVNHDVARSPGKSAKKASTKTSRASKDGDSDEETLSNTSKSDRDDAAQIYYTKLDGLIGWDITETSLRRLFKDVDASFGDKTETDRYGKKVVDEIGREQNILLLKMDCSTDFDRGFDGLFLVEELAPIFEHEQELGRKIVFWVDRAADGGAILPWVSPHIFFTPEGVMGFTNDLENYRFGDRMVDQKQISLRIGHAEGFLLEGGYAPEIIKAMVRSRYWLYYRLVGGKPEYLTRRPRETDGDGWLLLSDNGRGKNKDRFHLLSRNMNDRLVLYADLADKLNISDGTCTTVDDIAYFFDIDRNYRVIESDGLTIFKDWGKELDRAVAKINRTQELNKGRQGTLWKEFNEIQVQGPYRERRKARARQLTLLKQIRSILVRYADVFGGQFNPTGVTIQDIDIEIELIKQAQARDAKTRNRGGGGGGGGGGLGG